MSHTKPNPLSLYTKLFKQTAIYGMAAVLPKIFSFLLVPLYTEYLDSEAEYGRVSVLFGWMIFFNVILSYGMETAFFRFYNKEQDKKNVLDTSMVSVFWTSVFFLGIGLVFRRSLAEWTQIGAEYITFLIWILALDALVVVPFSRLRALQRPLAYAVIKVGNVAVNLSLNVFFLVFLPEIAAKHPDGFLGSLYYENFQVGYIFVSNIIASFLTLAAFSPDYFRLRWHFDGALWKRMMRYGLPVMVAGIAFAINEQFDKILLQRLLPADVAESEVGIYAACYKLGLFMVLFRTAYTLGIEPFFFSHADKENAANTYATITKYFVIFGSFIQLAVIVFADVLKQIMLQDSRYWEGMDVVPLIIFANFFLGIYTNLSVWYKLTDKTYVGALISLVGAAVTLALNFWLIPMQGPFGGYYGSAIATIAAYGTMMLISYLLGQRHYPIPYDKKRIGGYLVLSILFSVTYFYGFRENYIVGALFMGVLLGIIYFLERDAVQRILARREKPQVAVSAGPENENQIL